MNLIDEMMAEIAKSFKEDADHIDTMIMQRIDDIGAVAEVIEKHQGIEARERFYEASAFDRFYGRNG